MCIYDGIVNAYIKKQEKLRWHFRDINEISHKNNNQLFISNTARDIVGAKILWQLLWYYVFVTKSVRTLCYVIWVGTSTQWNIIQRVRTLFVTHTLHKKYDTYHDSCRCEIAKLTVFFFNIWWRTLHFLQLHILPKLEHSEIGLKVFKTLHTIHDIVNKTLN